MKARNVYTEMLSDGNNPEKILIFKKWLHLSSSLHSFFFLARHISFTF